MTSGHKLPVFVLSTHYGLEDLRAELTSFLEDLGLLAFVSSEAGFPDHPGMQPYASCLRVLERCLLVVGIIDRRYGKQFEDWKPYPQYGSLSPTHAELRHALATGKRLVIYVRDDVNSFYEVYRKNKDAFKEPSLPNGLDLMTLEMYGEIKQHDPAPWIEPFKDIRGLKAAIQQRLLNDLYELMLQRETILSDHVETLTNALLTSDPSVSEAVMAAADSVASAKVQELDY